jgi:hypothetical protein
MVNKYRGSEIEVRMATTQAALTSATAIPNVQTASWKLDQGIVDVPDGLGSRKTDPKEGLTKVTGSIVRDYDEEPVDGTNDFATEANAFEAEALTRHWLEIKVKTTGKKYQFSNVIGSPDMSAPSVDGLVTQRFDWHADALTTTT